MSDFEVFIKKNNLKKSAIAQYIGVSNGFITQIINGSRKLPHDKLLKIIANPDWDISMFGEREMLKRNTESEIEPNQNIEDMQTKELIVAFRESREMLAEALDQNSRLIGVIERMQGIDHSATGIRKSPPLVFRPETK